MTRQGLLTLARQVGRGGGSGGGGQQGRAVQVDHIKPKSKLPGTKCLKLKCDEPLSCFAFNFNLRRYSKAASKGAAGYMSERGGGTGTVTTGGSERPSADQARPARSCPPRHRHAF